MAKGFDVVNWDEVKRLHDLWETIEHLTNHHKLIDTAQATVYMQELLNKLADELAVPHVII